MLRFLKVRLEAFTDDFNNGLKAAQKEAKEFEKTIKPSKELLTSMGTVATTAGLAVVGSMTAMAKAAANYGDELLDASRRTGASVEELAKLKFAAEQSGASFGDVSAGLRVLAKNMEAAADGSAKQTAAFRDLGISVLDSSGKLRPMNDLLGDVADRFAGMEDGAEKAALAQELFGRGGTALIPVLSEGRAGLKNMGDMAERLGLVISTQAAKAADEFNDTLDQNKAALQGLSNAIGQAILPAMTKMAATTRDTVAGFSAWAKEHETLTKAIFGSALALTGAGGLLLGMAAIATIVPKVKLAIDGLTIAYRALAASQLAAQLGAAGLGAGIGIGIGLLINQQIEGTKTRQVMDDLARSLGNKVFSEAGIDARNMTRETERLSESLRQQGIIVERGSMSLIEWNAAVIKAAQSGPKLTTALEQQAKAQKESNEHHAFFLSISQGFAKNTGQVLADIYEKNATAAKKFGDEQKKAAEELDALWRQLNQRRIDRLIDEITTAQRRNSNEFADWLRTVENGTARITTIARTLYDNIDAFGSADRFRENEERRIAIFGDSIEKMNSMAVPAAVFLGNELKKPPNEMSKAFSVALGNITSGFANAITDSIFHAKKWSESLMGIAESTAKNMLNAFLVGLLAPLTSQLAGLGTTLGRILTGGGAATTAAGAATSAAGAASSATSAAGSVASTIGGVAGAINMASGIAGAIGGVATAFGVARLEGTMNAVEYNTRATNINLEAAINQIFWPMRFDLSAIRDDGHVATTQLDAIYNAIIALGIGSGAGAQNMEVTMTRLLEMLGVNWRGSLEQLVRLIRGAEPGVVSGPA